MKTVRIIFFSGLLWLVAQAARAQSADEFFNGGAQFYISNNIADAWKKVEAGRKIYPEDEKLKKLEELLKQQQQQQQQQNKQNQSQKSQNSKNQQSKQQQNQDQNRQNAQKQQQNSQSQQNQQAQAMTPKEAKRLLDSQKGNEQILTYKPPNQPENQNPPIKDW